MSEGTTIQYLFWTIQCTKPKLENFGQGALVTCTEILVIVLRFGGIFSHLDISLINFIFKNKIEFWWLKNWKENL